MDNSDLTALVSSRICHDLISPIGAISNGVELITEQSTTPSPELDLIGDSVSSATAKLRYFRIAFGAVPPDSWLQEAELRAAVETMFGGRSSMTLDLPPEGLPRLVSKALFLALLCLEKCLPLGGDTKAAAHLKGFTIATTARRTRAQPELWALMDKGLNGTEVAPGDVQFLLLGDLRRSAGFTLDHQVGEEAIQISATGF